MKTLKLLNPGYENIVHSEDFTPIAILCDSDIEEPSSSEIESEFASEDDNELSSEEASEGASEGSSEIYNQTIVYELDDATKEDIHNISHFSVLLFVVAGTAFIIWLIALVNKELNRFIG